MKWEIENPNKKTIKKKMTKKTLIKQILMKIPMKIPVMMRRRTMMNMEDTVKKKKMVPRTIPTARSMMNPLRSLTSKN
jgi:hypothetical protein